MTTLGAGNRAKGTAEVERSCAEQSTPNSADWAHLARVNRRQRYGAQPGALADALVRRGLATRAAGAAGAALAAARSDGSTGPGRPTVSVVASGDLYLSSRVNRAQTARAIDGELASVLTPTRARSVTIVVGAGDDRG